MFTNYIYCGDCIDLCKQLDENSVDLIIADPPYFKINGEFDYEWKTVDEYINWCKLWIKQFRRILKPSGSFYLWGAIGYNRGFALPKLADWIESENIFIIKNWITQKNCRGYGNSSNYMKCREELLFMTKFNSKSYTWNNAYTNEKTNRNDLGSNNKPRKNEFKRCSDVWIDFNNCANNDILFCTKNIEESHLDIWTITEASQSSKQRFKTNNGENFPTVKSLDLCDRIINASSNPGDIVFVPFAGSGSEIISSINNNRFFIASEIKQEYIDEIILKQRIVKMGFKYTYSSNTNKYILEKALN